jgi:hypothetical protein
VSEQVTSAAYRNFVDSCRAPATRVAYIKGLHYFMNYLCLPTDAYDILLEKDPKTIQMDICDFIKFLKKDRSSAAVSLYLAALRKFYDMNDIPMLNWKKIASFQGEREKVAEDRPYTHSEIHTLTQKTTERNRAIILLMSSSGPRLGAIPYIRIKDLEPIDKYNIYKVTYYPHSKQSRYFSFCTPECRKAIDDYIDWRKRFGERIVEDSPLFRKDFNIHKMPAAKPVTTVAIGDFMSSLLLHSGLRDIPIEGKIKRSEVMMNHGFRKFFEKHAHKAGMDHIYIRRLMGQKSGLEDSYLKLSEDELLEGDSKHIGYIGVIDQLTINEENKLKRKVQTLQTEKSETEELKKKIEELEGRIALSPEAKVRWDKMDAFAREKGLW